MFTNVLLENIANYHKIYTNILHSKAPPKYTQIGIFGVYENLPSGNPVTDTLELQPKVRTVGVIGIVRQYRKMIRVFSDIEQKTFFKSFRANHGRGHFRIE
jgi:hypothetical protein